MISAVDFESVSRFLKLHSGLILGSDKQYLLESRLLPLLRKFELADFARLASIIRDQPSGVIAEAVLEAMTTNESLFFRDKSPFEHFTKIMLPKLNATRRPGDPLRIWCAAASTGQEPYSIAMLLLENPHLTGGRRVEIVGTDLSGEVLDRARQGRYTQFEVQRGMPVQLLLKYFEKDGENWQVKSDLRSMVDYRKLNLLHNFSHLGVFDIVFCRNVLIYFDAATKRDILGRVARVLRPDGYLLLGGAETVLGLSDAFRSVPSQPGFYVPNVPAMAGA
ncbi:CheR family methyltransferase [Roseixanthobacter liquoris]|uniref:CheR family methyltransferase n=1 Tax=Roseixanthobacter liquoris TaxID=3119921 RepID=UPI00372B54BF